MASLNVMTAVEARLGAAWSGIPVVTPNTDRGRPSDGSPFLTVQYPVSSERFVGMAGVGNRTYREEGSIRIVLSAPRGRGRTQAHQWIEGLRDFFRAQTFDGVVCREASPPVENNDNDTGAYWVLSTVITYFYDQFK